MSDEVTAPVAADSIAKPAKAALYAKNKTALAKAVGRSRKTIDRWSKESGFPKPISNGKISVTAVLAWMESNGKANEQEPAATAKDKPNQTELKNRLLDAQRRKIDHQLAVAKRVYIPTADAQAAIGAMVAEAKKVLLSGPAALAPQVIGVTAPEAEKLLREWLHDALARMEQNPIGKATS